VTTITRAVLAVVVMVLAAAASVPAAGESAPGAQSAQGGRRGGEAAGAAEPGVSPAEVQKMFDAYALMQAQDQLKIADEQFARFLTRYKALQDVRRKAVQEHARLIMELRRLLNAPPVDEAQLKERMAALQDLEGRSAADIKKAYEAVDQVLEVPQQAKFRVFEELMERRKLELVTRARQANRKNQQ
jgi:Spy/CpxP family protein refolding chaperone